LYEYVVLDRDEAAAEAIQRNNAQHAARKNQDVATADPVQPSSLAKSDEAAEQRRMTQLDEKLKRLDETSPYRGN
ncbi:hypothetical protein GGI06_000412, partial [Coemansia sp. S85]